MLPLLAAAVLERGMKRAYLLGYVAGAIFNAGSCYWFVFVMERYGGMGTVLAVGVLLLFVLVFSNIFAGFTLAVAWMGKRSRGLAILAAPFLWVAMELARTYFMSGFPWDLLGYAVEPIGLRQLASVTAVYGLSFLAVATSAFLAWWLLEPRDTRRIALCAGWVVLLLVANFFSFFVPAQKSSQPSHDALLVQTDIPLDETKLEQWIPWKDPTRLRLLVESITETVCAGQPMHGYGMFPGCAASTPERAAARPLVILPENPAPFYYDRDSVFRFALANLARQTGAYVISGTTTFDDASKRPRNSAVVLDPEGKLLLVYDKIHLVPFGEYVPWWGFPSLVGKITFEAGDFIAGKDYKVAATPDGNIGVFICYEAVFPQLVRRLAKQNTGVLVNISDDGWFGNSAAAAQHLRMARMRAIENGRYVLRATNDGITVIINPRGEVKASLPRYRAEILSGKFEYLSRTTFYTAHGDVFAWLAAAIAAGLMAASRFAKAKKELP